MSNRNMEANENYQFSWDAYHENIANTFSELLAESDFFDITLGSSDGRFLQAHKVVLASCSPLFKEILRFQAMNNFPSSLIYLRGVNFKELSAILDFMYHGFTTVPQKEISCFLSAAEELKIKGLT